MDNTQPTRTVKKKFLRADTIGRGVKTVGKPVLYVVATVGLYLAKEALATKDEDDNEYDDDDDDD